MIEIDLKLNVLSSKADEDIHNKFDKLLVNHDPFLKQKSASTVAYLNLINVLADSTILCSVAVLYALDAFTQSILFISCLLLLTSFISTFLAIAIKTLSNVDSRSQHLRQFQQQSTRLKLFYTISIMIHSTLLYFVNEAVQTRLRSDESSDSVRSLLLVIENALFIKSIAFGICFVITLSHTLTKGNRISIYSYIIDSIVVLFILVGLTTLLIYQFHFVIIILHLHLHLCSSVHDSTQFEQFGTTSTYVENAEKKCCFPCCSDGFNPCHYCGCDCVPAGCDVNDVNQGCCACTYDSRNFCYLNWCGFCVCDGNCCCCCTGSHVDIPNLCCSWCGICSCYCCDPGGCLDCCCCSFDFFTWCCCKACC